MNHMCCRVALISVRAVTGGFYQLATEPKVNPPFPLLILLLADTTFDQDCEGSRAIPFLHMAMDVMMT